MKKLGSTGLLVHPLCLGGNVFGWTADEAQSFAVLDAYAAAGGNFIDTADTYSSWVPGHAGGESETILGRWMKARGNRTRVVIATKVGLHPGHPGLSAKNVREAAEASLQRLQVDCIDLYYAHRDDEGTPLEETLGAFDALVRAGKVRHVAASNYGAGRLAQLLAVARRDDLAPVEVLQPEYNLMVRDRFEGPLQALAAAEGLACLPYWSLAKGFLTGKYRRGAKVDSPRAEGASAYLDARGERVLAALDTVAHAHETTVAAVALAWLAAQKTVASVIASARTPEQLAEILPVATLTLDPAELDALTRASDVHAG